MINRRDFLSRSLVGASAVTALGIPHLALTQDTTDKDGLLVWLDMNQSQLDAAYDQSAYAPNMELVLRRMEKQAAAARARLGEPEYYSYGSSPIERLLFYRADEDVAPVQIYVHGGTWRFGSAKGQIDKAESVIHAGGHVALLDFDRVDDEDVSLTVLARQVRDAVAWVYTNAAKLGVDQNQIFVSGHSSGGHLVGVILTTDWVRDYDLPPNVVSGGMCTSGMFDLEPVRLSWRNSYLQLTDEEEQMLSPQRHIDQLKAPLIVAYGTEETPEFQRQSKDFSAAVKAAGKPVKLLLAEGYNHFEIAETYANPFGLLGRAVLEQMSLVDP